MSMSIFHHVVVIKIIPYKTVFSYYTQNCVLHKSGSGDDDVLLVFYLIRGIFMSYIFYYGICRILAMIVLL